MVRTLYSQILVLIHVNRFFFQNEIATSLVELNTKVMFYEFLKQLMSPYTLIYVSSVPYICSHINNVLNR